MSTKISVDIASTPRDQELGLQFVKELPEFSGMLFDFHYPKVLNFFMKNTVLPLDIAFIGTDGRVVKTERMIPMSLKTVSSGSPCVMALEVPAGTLEKAGCQVGSVMKLDRDNNKVEFCASN